MNALASIKRRLRGGPRELEPNFTTELVYERLFSRAVDNLQIKNDFFAIKGAANFSLLYLVLRSVLEGGVRSVLEFGSGQTTILLDRLSEKFDLQIDTIEHDPDWAGRIGQQVRHRVQQVDLAEMHVGGRDIRSYKFPEGLRESYDMVLVDGPFAATEETMYSRLGTLPIIERCSPDDGLILIDDYQRIGEQELGGRCMELRRKKYPDAVLSTTAAAKWQAAITCGRFAVVRHF